jgi:hypothetical protein
MLLISHANIVSPPGRLHKQHEGAISNGTVFKPRLPLVGVPGMFSLAPLLLKDLISNRRREHVAGAVPS